MANADIIPVGFAELPTLARLFNEVFRPAREMGFFERRLQGRLNPLMLLAQVGGQPAGFAIGYENKPGTFYCWLLGVRVDFRNRGIASQLMEAITAWGHDNGYHTVRFECFNRQKPMLLLAIRQGFDIVGIRHDVDTGNDLLILEHYLDDDQESE